MQVRSTITLLILGLMIGSAAYADNSELEKSFFSAAYDTVATFAYDNIIEPAITITKIIGHRLYLARFAHRLGMPYEKFLNCSSVPGTTKEAVTSATKNFPRSFVKKIRFKVFKCHHPAGTASEAFFSNLILLYSDFFDFNVEEQTAILAHELAHLYGKHLQKQLLFIAAISVGFCLYYYAVCESFVTNKVYRCMNLVGTDVGVFLASRRFANWQERRADLEAARRLGSAKGLISVFEKVKKLSREYGLATSSCWQDWFGTHPSLDTRIKYLTAFDCSHL
jgi:Zn-dependent protease with chaperone function